MNTNPDQQILARWRESYGWWNDEPYREVIKTLDGNGKVHRIEKHAPPLGQKLSSGQTQHKEDHTQDWGLKEKKVRDVKAALAQGRLPSHYYDRQIQERHGLPTFQSSSMLKQGSHYAPLRCISGYSFGRSVILAEELPALAAAAGCSVAAITDHFSLSGAYEFAKAGKRHGIKTILGATFTLEGGGDIVLLVRNKTGYRNLCRLITKCHLEEPRGFPLANLDRIAQHADGLICLTGGDRGPINLLLQTGKDKESYEYLSLLSNIFKKGSLYIEIERSFHPWTQAINSKLLQLADKSGVPFVAGGPITHARRSHFPAQDILACAHNLATVEDPIGRKPFYDDGQSPLPSHPRRALNAEHFFHSGQEMAALFADIPQALQNSLEIAEKCDSDVFPSRPPLPSLFEDDDIALREIVEANAHFAYPNYTPLHRQRLRMEVDRIIRLGFSSHFLIASEMCRWAGEHAIHLSGRGSAVDSAVAYVLGFSRIDAIKHNLHFDRFLPADGSKRPDIDIDFEARRRDEVRGYLIRRFGVERTAQVAAIGSYRTRGILRQVGKAMELPESLVNELAKRLHGGVSPDHLADALSKRPELRDHPMDKARFRWAIQLAGRLMDVPFDIGCHSSGLVVSSQPISDYVPIMWSATPSHPTAQTTEPFLRLMQWDKRSSKSLFDKFDILCLRGQDVISGTEQRMRVHQPTFDAKKIDVDDPEIYRAMRSGELIGIPQSASPAMRQAHIRLQTNNLHDASLVQAGIRPGVGGAVKINELIARRRGKPFQFAHPDFEPILGHTYGIIVFQEQVDQLLQHFCGCTSGEAEDIRDSIHKRRREDYGQAIREQLLDRCLAQGFSAETAEHVCNLVAGFKGFGFAQGHALAFAEVSLRSLYLMQNQPSSYFAALLSAQPAGYYGPCTIANEARLRGVAMLHPCVNRSQELFTVEDISMQSGLTIPDAAIRTGLMQINGISSGLKERIIASQLQVTAPFYKPLVPLQEVGLKHRLGHIALLDAQQDPPLPLAPKAFASFFDFAAKTNPHQDELEALILAGAFDDLCPNRRALLWAIPLAQEYARASKALSGPDTLPIQLPEPPLEANIEDFSVEEKAVLQRSVLGMDIDHHLMAFERERVSRKAMTTLEIKSQSDGQHAMAVGNPIRLRFPPTASGKRVVFFDLEDETGLLNVTAFDDVYQVFGKAIVTSPYVTVIGEVQNRDGHKAFLAHEVYSYKPALLKKTNTSIPIHGADFLGR